MPCPVLRSAIRLLIALSFITHCAARANPIAGDIVEPPHLMVAENVLVGVTKTGVVVSGRFRFRVRPDAAEQWLKPPYRLSVQLPVPVSSDLKEFTDIESAVHPFMTLKGARYEPLKTIFSYDVPALPASVKLAVFLFRVDRADLENEFEFEMQYDQPVITIDGKEMVYYVPFLPRYETYESRMHLKKDSFLISFESYEDASLRLTRYLGPVVQQGPRLISVRPEHKELIAIERVNATATSPTDPTRTK